MPTKTKIQKKTKKSESEEITDTVDILNISDIAVSPLEPQTRRRARFMTEKGLEDVDALGNSIKTKGLRQPILVRPIPVLDKRKENYEIVFGERRWLASKRKGLTTLRSFVEKLTDAEVVELQYVENHQRQETDPLDDAFTFKFLIESQGYTEQMLADKFAISAKTVKNRIVLNDLIPEAVQELADGHLPLKHAYYLAGFPEAAQKEIVENEYAYKYGNKEDGAVSYDDFAREVEDEIVRQLQTAAFDPADERLHIKKLKCGDCPENTIRQPLLFDGDTGIGKCLNKECFESKTNIHLKIKRAELAENLPNPTNLPVGKLEKNIPLVTESGWAEKSDTVFDEKILIRQTLLEKPECESSIPALVAKGEKKGAGVWVCNNDKCEIHHPENTGADSDSGGMTDYQLKEKESEFNLNVAKAVREKVFAHSIEFFDGSNSFWQYADLVEKLIVEFLIERSYEMGYLKGVFKGWKNVPKDFHQSNRENVETFVASLNSRRRDQLLFLIVFSKVGQMSWRHEPQDGVIELANDFAKLDYDSLDADVRLKLAPDEFKQIAIDYRKKLKSGKKTEIPHFWWTEESE